MTSTQFSSSPVKTNKTTSPIPVADNELEKWSIIIYGLPQSKAEVAAVCVRHDIASLESYFKCALATNESQTLYTAYRVGTLDSKSPDKPRQVEIILCSTTNSTQPKKKTTFGKARLLFSPDLPKVRTVEISGPQRRAAAQQGPGRKRSHISEKVFSGTHPL